MHHRGCLSADRNGTADRERPRWPSLIRPRWPLLDPRRRRMFLRNEGVGTHACPLVYHVDVQHRGHSDTITSADLSAIAGPCKYAPAGARKTAAALSLSKLHFLRVGERRGGEAAGDKRSYIFYTLGPPSIGHIRPTEVRLPRISLV